MQMFLLKQLISTFITINTTPPIVRCRSRLHYSKDTPYVLKASVTNSNAEGLYLFLGGLGRAYNLKLAWQLPLDQILNLTNQLLPIDICRKLEKLLQEN
jgi:hypothetical protein